MKKRVDLIFNKLFFLVKKCDTRYMLSSKNCPPSTICVEKDENQLEVFEGVCQCGDQYVFNPNYTSDDEYCIKNVIFNKSSTSGSFIDGRNFSKNKLTSKPHHILVGIFLPIAFVLIVLSGIFVVTQRIRNTRRIHRNRPFYQDVMLGVNDNDDPPLI